MFNQNITKRGTLLTVLGAVIVRCSPDSQHGRSDSHPANFDCSFFRYANDDLRNHKSETQIQGMD